MDDKLARKISRKLTVLTVIMALFMMLTIGMFVVAGIFAIGVAREINDAKNSLTSVQQKATDTLNVQDELCSDTGSFGSLLRSQSDVCN